MLEDEHCCYEQVFVEAASDLKVLVLSSRGGRASTLLLLGAKQ